MNSVGLIPSLQQTTVKTRILLCIHTVVVPQLRLATLARCSRLRQTLQRPSFPDAQRAEITTVKAVTERFVAVSRAPANADIIPAPQQSETAKRSEIKL